MNAIPKRPRTEIDAVAGTKLCRDCLVSKPLSAYHKARVGVMNTCKTCQARRRKRTKPATSP
jgi:hypothetical protein